MAPHLLLEKSRSRIPCYLLLSLLVTTICPSRLLFVALGARTLVATPQFPLCNTTPYPSMCTGILSTLPANTPLNQQIATISEYALTLTESTRGVIAKATGSGSSKEESGVVTMAAGSTDSKLAEEALEDCMELMGNSVDNLKVSIGKVSSLKLGAAKTARGQLMDAQVALSASLTFQGTCQDEVSEQASKIPGTAAVLLRQSTAISQALTVSLSLAGTLQKSLHA